MARISTIVRAWTWLWLASVQALVYGSDVLAASLPATPAVPKATDVEVAAFWSEVFNGPPPYGVPDLNAQRFNPRRVRDATLWDVRFDSYRDPDTDRPARLGGVFAVPRGMAAPAADGTFPGLVVTHSVGVERPQPDNAEELAAFFAGRGYATLAFYLRGYGTSRLKRLNVDSPHGRCGGFLCANLTDAGEPPLDSVWAGFAVDAFQAGEFVAAQPEVLDPGSLTFVGHSLGGFAALHGGIFSERFKVIAASAPAATTPDPDAWMDYWKPSPWRRWAEGEADPARALGLLTRMWSFTGTYPALDNPWLAAANPSWTLENADLFLYGGERDPAVPATDVEAAYRRADESNTRVFYRSPTGTHGGMETWRRTQAWLAGHYPGRVGSPPLAALSVVRKAGRTVTFSAERSRDDDVLMTWIYDFGDGTTRHWGAAVSYAYTAPGVYTATVTVIDGAGLRDTAAVTVTID